MRVKNCRETVRSQFLPRGIKMSRTLRLLNALNSEDRGLKVRFSLAMIVFEIFELILCQMLSSQGKNAPSNPYPHYFVRLATSRQGPLGLQEGKRTPIPTITALLRKRPVLRRANLRVAPVRFGCGFQGKFLRVRRGCQASQRKG